MPAIPSPAAEMYTLRLLPLLLVLSLGLTACGREGAPTSATDEPQLVLAAEQGDLALLEQLLIGVPTVDVRDSCAWTPLMKAALNGHLAAAERLLLAGADTGLRDKGGYTPLMLAASNNHVEVVRLLLEYGADPDRREHTRGWTALIWAAKRGHLDTVQALLRGGADTRFLDQEHQSALDWAQAQGHRRVAHALQPVSYTHLTLPTICFKCRSRWSPYH